MTVSLLNRRKAVVVVGESWNIQHLYGKFTLLDAPRDHTKHCKFENKIGWCLPYALRAGAFAYGPSRKRLDLVGLRWDAAMNLLPPMPAQSWEKAAAMAMAKAVVEALGDLSPVIVMLGERVLRAFNAATVGELTDMDLWERRLVNGVAFYSWPHPSGRCRVWNDASARSAARKSAEKIAAERGA